MARPRSDQSNKKRSSIRTIRPRLEALEHRRLLAASDAKLLAFLAEASQELGPQAIVGGQASERGSREWVVSVQDSFGHFCGGTLVAEDAVVTAAHCVEGISVSSLVAVIGREDLNRTDDGQRVRVSQMVLHPDYDSTSNDADIAVLRLSESVDSQPIGYLTSDTATLADAGRDATALGWGTIREGGDPVSTLQEVTVPLVSNEVANLPISYGGDITERMLAAGRAQGGIDSCQGDSGGPLVVSDNLGNPRLAGVVSWGEGCGRANKYGIYARVTSFADWLDEVIGIGPSGQIDFTQERLLVGDTARFVLRDRNVDGELVQVTVNSASGDEETITLESFSPGRFRGEIPITDGPLALANDELNVAGEEQITVTYLDADDGTGTAKTLTATAQVIEDDFGNSAAEAASLVASNGTVEVEAEIEFAGDSDWFRFELQAGTGYIFSQDLTGSLDDSTLALYAEDGITVLGFDDDGGRGLGSELTYFPTQSGTVYVEASGFAAHVGGYTLLIRETSDTGDDHPDIVGGAMTVDQIASGSIDTVGDTDWFAFDVTAGNNYQVRVQHRSMTDSQLRLVDADGKTELAFNDDRDFFSTEAQLFFRADETKRLSVEVSGFGDATGSYDLRIRELPDDHGHLPEAATKLGDVTTLTSRTGELSPVDSDWFAFTAERDAFYRLETTLGTLPDSVLRVFDPEGQQVLAQNDDFTSNTLPSRLIWQAPEDAQYFAEVTGFEQSSGDYSISVERLASPPTDEFGNRAEYASELQIGEAVSGNVDYQADQDWLRFDAIAGNTYTLEVQLGTLQDSFLEIYDANGTTLLAENDDVEYPDRSSRVVWTANTTGTKHVVVAGFDGFLGSYQLLSSVVMPEFRLGDLDRNGALDEQDIDAFYSALRDESANEQWDFNQDGEVTADDATTLVVDYLGTNFGDADLNSSVSFPDFLVVARNFGGSGGWGDGDFNGDGEIAFEDFLILARNFGLG